MTQALLTKDLNTNEYAEYFRGYLEKIGDAEVIKLLQTQGGMLHQIFDSVDDQEASKLHEPYTWTLKQVLGHIIDVEKVFGSRAHRIAFGEDQTLPGFDHDKFVNDTDYGSVGVADLVKEFEYLRVSNCMMLDRLTPAMWQRIGQCDDKKISVRAIACLLAGHFIHHVTIAQERLAS